MMKKFILSLLVISLCLSLAACDFVNDLLNHVSTEGDQFTSYKNQVTKDEFQQQYKKAFDSLQPDYTRDFVYIYTNDFKEVYEGGEDTQSTRERIEYDADSEIILRQ